MSSFSLADCHEYWVNFKDKSVYKIILSMESTESWVIENTPELDAKLDKLYACIYNMEGLDIDFAEKIIKIIAYLKISQMLRILQALDEVIPGAATKVLEFAEKASNDDKCVKIFLSRNVVFERLRLLYRILAPERLSLIQSAIEEHQHG